MVGLPDELRGTETDCSEDDWVAVLGRSLEARLTKDPQSRLNDVLPALERLLMQTALKHTGGKRQAAARLLGWGRNTLTRKLRKTDA